MGTAASPPPDAPSARPRRRPPGWFFVLVAVLIAAGLVAPLTVGWIIRHQEATIPPDTTGNRSDSVRADTAARDSVQRRP